MSKLLVFVGSLNREAPYFQGARGVGLSGKLLILTVIFVMISEVLIFVPSIANFRNTWLTDKLTIAGVAASVLVETDTVSPAVQAELLRATGALAVALDEGERRRLIATGTKNGKAPSRDGAFRMSA